MFFNGKKVEYFDFTGKKQDVSMEIDPSRCLFKIDGNIHTWQSARVELAKGFTDNTQIRYREGTIRELSDDAMRLQVLQGCQNDNAKFKPNLQELQIIQGYVQKNEPNNQNLQTRLNQKIVERSTGQAQPSGLAGEEKSQPTKDAAPSKWKMIAKAAGGVLLAAGGIALGAACVTAGIAISAASFGGATAIGFAIGAAGVAVGTMAVKAAIPIVTSAYEDYKDAKSLKNDIKTAQSQGLAQAKGHAQSQGRQQVQDRAHTPNIDPASAQRTQDMIRGFQEDQSRSSMAQKGFSPTQVPSSKNAGKDSINIY